MLNHREGTTIKVNFLVLLIVISLSACNSTKKTLPALLEESSDQGVNPESPWNLPEGWRSYNNVEGEYFKIYVPPDWSWSGLPDQDNGKVHGMTFTGPEGGVEVFWGIDVDKACPTGVKQIDLNVQGSGCYNVLSDGTEVWAWKDTGRVGDVTYMLRAYTNDPQLNRAEVHTVLRYFTTFTPE